MMWRSRRARSFSRLLAVNDVQVLPWPAYSADINFTKSAKSLNLDFEKGSK